MVNQVVDEIATMTNDGKLADKVKDAAWTYSYSQPELNSVTALRVLTAFANRTKRGEKITIEQVINEDLITKPLRRFL